MASVLTFSRAPANSAAASLRIVDVCGVMLSGLCAVHCAVTPVLVTVLPAVAGEGTETQLRRVLITLGLLGVGLGTALHRDRRGLVPLAGGLLLAALLEVGAVVAAWEVFVSLGISALLISAHALNTRACNTHCHGCAPARFWTAQVEALGASKLGPGLLAIAAAILVHATVLAVALRVEASPAARSSAHAGERIVEVELQPAALSAAQGSPSERSAFEAPQTAPHLAASMAAAPHSASAAEATPALDASAPVVFEDVLAVPQSANAPAVFHQVARSAPGNASGGQARFGASSASAVGKPGASGSAGGSAADSAPAGGARLLRPPSQPPGLEARIESHYPPRARLQQVSGVGRARLLVSAEGVVTRAEPVSESPSTSGFAQACAKALSGSRGWGEPQDASGRPTSTWIRFSCEFSIRH